MQGFDPQTGAALVQNAGRENHRPGWDLTFSAPKSVSLAYAVADPEQRQQIEQAQQKAADQAMAYLEQYAEVRTGKGGTDRESCKLLHASWQHVTSRAQDPQLHTHVTIANAGLCQDGKFRTLETRQIYESKMAAGAIYRAELATQLQEMGLKIEKDRDYFQIAGSSKELESLYSKRSDEIKKAIQEKGVSGAKAAEIAALHTRTKKESVSRQELFETWQIEAKEHNFSFENMQNVEEVAEFERKTDEQILKDLTERQSTFKPQDLMQQVAINEAGNLNAEQVQEKAAKLMESREIVQLQNPKTGEMRLTTHEMLQIEKGMVESAEQMHNTTTHEVKADSIESAVKSRTLSAEQENALRHMTDSNQISALVGIAGAGKSYTLGAAREAWESSGYKTIGAALSGKAAQGLQESADIKSDTIHATLKNLEKGDLQLDEKTILVIDEAGMVGSRQTAKLIEHAQESGAKLVLVGDHKQLQPIDAGGAFKAIQNKIGAAEMVENRRQKEQWAAQAANQIRSGSALKALNEYQQRGQLHINSDTQEASRNLVNKWNQNINSVGDVKENLILASTKKEVSALNELARGSMQEKGLLGASTHIQTESGKLEISEGDRVLFNRNNRYLGVKNGTLGHVERISTTQILVKTDDGNKINLYGSDYEHVSHGYAVTTHKSQGVTVQNSFILNSGAMASSELSYVQMSRHKNEAHLFIDRQNFENQLRTELYNAEPTQKMSALAEQIATERQLELPGEARHDFWQCREFLNEHASNDLLKKEDAELLQQVAQKLGQEREKESTQDYTQVPETTQEQEREPELQQEPELEMEMEMEM
jgi:Ti-type conjugative transfer relaxase TraA